LLALGVAGPLTQKQREYLDRLRLSGDHLVELVNDVLDEAVAEMRAIVLFERGERDGVGKVASSCRTNAASPKLQRALANFGG